MFYARDHVPGGCRDRAFVRLDQAEAPPNLWWLSTDGIYRPGDEPSGARLRLLPPGPRPQSQAADLLAGDGLVHPKYRLPAWCFAYVGEAADPRTSHLPCLLADGTPDAARLPKAIQSILSTTGAHVSIPEAAIPEVLVTLARTTRTLGSCPPEADHPGHTPSSRKPSNNSAASPTHSPREGSRHRRTGQARTGT